MKSLCKACLLIVLMATSTPSISACLSDRDTLAMERERFPGVIELITGKFLRHSRYYYEWRVKQCEAIIASGEPKGAVYDDLAVAYEKLGDHEKAIETILKKEELYPGLYETYANLGTFYIHNGAFEKGIEQIERAIEINPDAHFGREAYQKLLVQYVLSKQVDGKTQLPLHEHPGGGFADFVLKRKNLVHDAERSREELAKARKGVLGMMRFGNHDSPILLEALANLLVPQYGHDPESDGKRLATYALLKASYESEDEKAANAYRELAEEALNLQTESLRSDEQLSLAKIEEVLKKQIVEAGDWYGELEALEIGWIEAGKNPDEEFARMFPEEPRISTTYDGPKMSTFQEKSGLHPWEATKIAVFVGLIVSVAVLVVGRILIGGDKKKIPDDG